MGGMNKNRYRNKTVCFRVSPDENRIIESRIKISGLPKAEYIIQALLKNGVKIAVGKYQSDRLSLELRRLRESYECLINSKDYKQIEELVKESNVLLKELERITSTQNDEEVGLSGYQSSKKK